MKKFFNWFFISMLMVIMLPIAGCDNDEYKVPEPGNLKADELVGTWTRGDKFQTIEKATIDEATSLYQFTAITFQEKGVVSATTENGDVAGSWSLSGNKLTLKIGDFSATCEVKTIGHTNANISLTYPTTGVMPETKDENGNVVPGETVKINLSVHYTKNAE